MLNEKQAEQRLEPLKVEDWLDLRLAAVAKLPDKLRKTGRVLLNRSEEGEAPDWEKHEETEARQLERFRGMSDRERGQLIESLFGPLAGDVEAGWQLLSRMPYSAAGYEDKAFRAPSDPSLVLKRRVEWLDSLHSVLGRYKQDAITVEWVAAWAPHIAEYNDEDVGVLLAAAIDAGGPSGQKVFDILVESAKGEHEVGGMGPHVTRSLLGASRPDAWEFVEKLLLAAQRQEGLRQSILESLGDAHPGAFRRILRVVLDNNLVRFSATVRAMDVWFGFLWDAVSTKKATDVIGRVAELLEEPAARKKAIEGKDAEDAYLGLWVTAFEDGPATVAPAAKMLSDRNPERRFVGAHMLSMLGFEKAERALIAALDDEDLRVSARALRHFTEGGKEPIPAIAKETDLFERLEKLIARVQGKQPKLKPIVWPWYAQKLDRQTVAGAMSDALGGRPPTRLIPYLKDMETYARSQVIEKLCEAKTWDAATRDVLFACAGDASEQVRESALKGLAKCKVTPQEAQKLEGYLQRKAADLRRGVIALLMNQPDDAALASADRLLAGAEPQRLAGLELLRQLAAAKRCADECRRRGEEYKASRKKLNKDESTYLEALSDAGRDVPKLDDALGLMDPAQRTKPVPPKKRDVKFVTPAAVELVKSLDALVHEHREEKIQIIERSWDEDDEEDTAEGGEGSGDAKPKARKVEEKLLGEVTYQFPSPRAGAIEKEVAFLPMREVWEQWYDGRGAKLRDGDGLELLRAQWLMEVDPSDYDDKPPWLKKIGEALAGGSKPPKLKYGHIVKDVLAWLMRLRPPEGQPDWMLDALETALAMIPPDKAAEREDEDESTDLTWREYDSPVNEMMTFAIPGGRPPPGWTTDHDVRYFRLKGWWDEPAPGVPRSRADLRTMALAYEAKAATEADLLDNLLGPRSGAGWRSSFDELANLTAHKPPKEFKQFAFLAPLGERCRARILEVELQRGDTPTAASPAATSLKWAGGLDVLARVLSAMAKAPFRRSSYSRGLSKSDVFSHLVQTTRPGEGDTPQRFAQVMKDAGISEDRLIEVAFFAPQWAGHVEKAIGWAGFGEGIWWITAHTKDSGESYGEEAEEKQARWKAQVGQHTPLTAPDLLEGAVDVAWFNRAYAALGKPRWEKLYDAAKYGTSGVGHKRAHLFADAMLGRVTRADMGKRVTAKRQGDAVRALGLVPLPKGDAGRDEVRARYKVLQEFLRTSKQFGSQRQASEKRAVAIGMQNLARSAGYPDPVRLQWAMEALETADLAKGPVVVKAGDVTVALSLDDEGQPQIAVTNKKTGKELASVPAAAKKDKKVQELHARRTELKRSASRMRQSLELAMVRGDAFTGAELRELMSNPVLAPMLGRVVFVGEGILGYPVAGGQGLRNEAGKVEPVKKAEKLRLAHPLDLLETKKWTAWQHDCFAAERVQPFKQVFRELYLPTKTELKDDKTESRRYAGHQVQPRQSLALLGGRGWVTSPEQGVYRTFHDERITAWLTFLEAFYTPADIEGFTLETVYFTRKGEHDPLDLADVPPRLFSETMRDLDLVVSVAHRGGVDPEASASTVQMRAALLRETSDLLKLDNVRIEEKASRVLIDGDLGSYSVHLGSGNAHRLPGGALFIVPVHSQHRGRLFLPFADNDPRTAEVVSKVLLLARDKEIQDPSILEQIRRA